MEDKYIGFQIDADLKEKFEEKLKQEDITASQKIRQWIRQYIGESTI